MSGPGPAPAPPFDPAAVGEFRFTGWTADWSTGVVELGYALGDAHRFTERYAFPLPAGAPAPARRAALVRAVRLLHLVAGVSYFKAAVPPRIVVEGPPPGAATAAFLGRLYTQGLGEFAWRNAMPEIGRG
ncbi:MAG: endonuclease domain-containing protein, partial [Thermoleophilia bacterium]|nr:endonuclease domain-containing protein [Thermoleophilia bacterium]